MPSLDHESRQGLSTHTSDFLEQGMLRNSPAVMKVKGSKSHASIEDHPVEVSTPLAVPSSLRPTSPRRAKSPTTATTPINTPIDGHHVEVSTIVTVPSLSPHTSPRKATSLGNVKALLLVLQKSLFFS